jgi:hypothetical protein
LDLDTDTLADLLTGKRPRDFSGRFTARNRSSTSFVSSSGDITPALTDSTRASSRLSGTYDFITDTQTSTPFSASPINLTQPLPQTPTETDDMAEIVEPFYGDKDNENPEGFLRAFYRRMGDKSDDSKKAQFPYYLQPYSVADEWYTSLVDNEKKSWSDIETAFRKRWPLQVPTKKTDEEFEDEIVGRKLKESDLGKKEKVAGMDVYTHIAWADKMAITIMSAKLEKTTTHLRQVKRELPDVLKEKVGTGHADWNAFLKAVKDIDVDYIRGYKARLDKEAEAQKAFDQRLRMLESVSRSPTAPLRQQLSSVTISSQPVTPRASTTGDPFANVGGGQGNLRFTTNPTTPRQPRPPPTLEQKAELRALLNTLPHHPDTQAGRQAHQAQQAEWIRAYGFGTRVTEKTPYPLRPGTSPANSGECFTCGNTGHLGARTGEHCTSLGHRVLHPNEQQWRAICSRILKEPRVATNIHFVAIDDYGSTLQDIQGNGEGPSA